MKQGVFRYIFVLAFIVLLVITYIIFYNNDDSATEIQDQTSTVSTLITDLRLGISEFDTLNPLATNNKNVKEVSRLIFDSLVNVGANYEIEFDLASEIGKSDNLTYIIKLREGVYFHDGIELTAQDVKFTIDTIKTSFSNSSYAENLAAVSGLEIVDSYTVKISLSYEVEFFEYNLTFPILSADYFKDEDFVNTEKNNLIVGTGMFKVVSNADNAIKLEKNENYWNEEKEPLITDISISLYSSIGEQYTAFKSGYIDIMNIEIDNVSDYVGSLGYIQKYYDTRDVDFLCFNTQNGVLVDPNVRKAIALFLDKDNIVANLGSGYNKANFCLTSSNFFYDSKLDVSSNAEEAEELLINAGWIYTENAWIKDGVQLSFTILVNGDDATRRTAAYVIASQLANYGITVYINETNNNNWGNYINSKNYDAVITGITMGYSPKISTLFTGDNLANYSNNRVNEILGETKTISDYGVLKEKYEEVYDEYLNDFPYIFLYRKTNSVIYNQTLCGTISPNSFSIFHNINQWYRQ